MNLFKIKRVTTNKPELPSQYTLTSQQLPLIQRQNGSLLATHWNSYLPHVSSHFTAKYSNTGRLVKYNIFLTNTFYTGCINTFVVVTVQSLACKYLNQHKGQFSRYVLQIIRDWKITAPVLRQNFRALSSSSSSSSSDNPESAETLSRYSDRPWEYLESEGKYD